MNTRDALIMAKTVMGYMLNWLHIREDSQLDGLFVRVPLGNGRWDNLSMSEVFALIDMALDINLAERMADQEMRSEYRDQMGELPPRDE